MNTTTVGSVAAIDLLVHITNNRTSGSGNRTTDDAPLLLRSILQLIHDYLDNNGANTWNLRYVAITSGIVLSLIRFIYPKHSYKIDWCSLIHAIITSVGSIICMYLDTSYAQYVGSDNITPTVATTIQMIHIAEPARTIQYCTTVLPLTSLHRILPAITLGYSILDFVHGLTLGIDFLFHGLITTLAVYYMVDVTNTPARMSSMLFMELSTIFLCFKDTTIFTPVIAQINMLCFVLTFFLSRCVVVPYIWYQLMKEIIVNYQTSTYQQCFPPHYMETIFVFGILFHALNGFWMYKIIQKVIRIVKRGGGDVKAKSTTKSLSTTSTVASSSSSDNDNVTEQEPKAIQDKKKD